MNDPQVRTSFLSLCEDVVQPKQWERLKAGDTLVQAGETLPMVYVIKSGLFKLSINHNEVSLTMGYLVAGDIAGLLGRESDFSYPYSIKAVVDTEVYCWERSKIDELMNLFPSIGNSIKSTQAVWAHKIVERLRSLVFYAPHQRIAGWISDYRKFEIYHKNKIWSLLTAGEMAEYCHVDIETLEQALSDFTHSEIIDISGGDCVVLDWEKLKFILGNSC